MAKKVTKINARTCQQSLLDPVHNNALPVETWWNMFFRWKSIALACIIFIFVIFIYQWATILVVVKDSILLPDEASKVVSMLELKGASSFGSSVGGVEPVVNETMEWNSTIIIGANRPNPTNLLGSPLAQLPIQFPSTEFDNVQLAVNISNQYAAKHKNDDLLVILLWTKLFRRDDWALGEQLGQVPFQKLKCPVQNCFVTADRDLQSKASAVLVNFRDDFNFDDLPEQRPDWQRWIFFLWESPEHTYDWQWQSSHRSQPWLKTKFGSFFNWTMTYRLDSDIPFLYGRFVRRSVPTRSLATFDFRKKLGSVIWIQSNCDTRSHRFTSSPLFTLFSNLLHFSCRSEFVAELAKYIAVDTVGTCGSRSNTATEQKTLAKCPRPDVFSPMGDECRQHLSSTYKFYLATENSLCKDYVTEKFFRAATLDIIPIVFNGAEMSKFAPPMSYINANQFESPKKLAEFLTVVSFFSHLSLFLFPFYF